MSAYFASIPDSKTEGVRAYREPAAPHPLQITFLEEAGERAWIAAMRGLLSAGRVAEADAQLTAALEGFDGSLARLCKATPPTDIVIEGWDDLLPILAEWEGPPISAITLGLTNPPDLVFEAGATHDPDLLLDLYSDEVFPFSSASKADLIAECGKEMPGWVDAEEDVEFHCTVSGLVPLNTALIHCKHRYFLRDGRDGVEGRAPGGYVEYILASWLLATRFLQAAKRAINEDGMPDGARLIIGTIGINADFVTVLGPDQPSALASVSGAAPAQPAFASLTIKPWVPREDPTADIIPSGQSLRDRIRQSEPAPAPVVAPALEAAVEAEAEPAPAPSFMARLFGRLRRG